MSDFESRTSPELHLSVLLSTETYLKLGNNEPPAGMVPVSPLAGGMPSCCPAGLATVAGRLEGSAGPRRSQGSWCSCLTIRNWTAALNSFLTSHLARHQMVNTFSPWLWGGSSDLKVKDCLAHALSLGWPVLSAWLCCPVKV